MELLGKKVDPVPPVLVPFMVRSAAARSIYGIFAVKTSYTINMQNRVCICYSID